MANYEVEVIAFIIQNSLFLVLHSGGLCRARTSDPHVVDVML